MLLCGWSPPAGEMALLLNWAGGVATVPQMLTPAPCANNWPAGLVLLPSEAEAIRLCECDGISLSNSDTVWVPPVSPRSCSDNPGPCPGCIGELPCMFGSAKFDLPSPP